MMYNYKAELIKVVDGDTVDLKVDLGFKLYMHERFRLLGINAPEIRGAEKHNGKLAKQFLINQLTDKQLLIRTHKQGKFGRWIASISTDNGETFVEDLLVEEGHAVYKDY